MNRRSPPRSVSFMLLPRTVVTWNMKMKISMPKTTAAQMLCSISKRENGSSFSPGPFPELVSSGRSPAADPSGSPGHGRNVLSLSSIGKPLTSLFLWQMIIHDFAGKEKP